MNLNGKHPGWDFAEKFSLLVFLTFFSWIFASKFDPTEIKMILGVVLAWAATRGGVTWMLRNGNRK